MSTVKSRSRIYAVLNVLLPLFFAFLVGAVFTIIIGYNPLVVYTEIIKNAFGSMTGWMQTLGFATPLIMTGIATAFCFKAGLWNIGVEGQLYMGAMGAAIVGGGYFFFDKLPAGLHMVIAILVGALCGLIYAAIPALMKAYLSVNEVVTTIMLNYAATYFTAYLVKAHFQGSQTFDATEEVMAGAAIPKFLSRYRVTWAVILAVVIVLVIWFVEARTKFGYEISAIGRQLEFSEAAGMRVKKKILIIFLISGAIAGTAGATEILGVNKYFIPNFSTNPGLGWQGYFICVLSKHNPLAVLIIALIFGGFRYGSITVQSSMGIPLDLVNIIQGALIIFYSIQYVSDNTKIFKRMTAKLEAKRS